MITISKNDTARTYPPPYPPPCAGQQQSPQQPPKFSIGKQIGGSFKQQHCCLPPHPPPKQALAYPMKARRRISFWKISLIFIPRNFKLN